MSNFKFWLAIVALSFIFGQKLALTASSCSIWSHNPQECTSENIGK